MDLIGMFLMMVTRKLPGNTRVFGCDEGFWDVLVWR